MEQLGLDSKLLVAQIVNFALFFYLFKRFMAEPLAGFISKQRREEDERERLIATLAEKETKLEEKTRESDLKMRREVSEVLSKARMEAEKLRQEIVLRAKREAEDLVEKGKGAVEEEREAMEKELKKKFARLAVSVVEEGLKEYITPSSKKELTGYILKQASQKSKFAKTHEN